MSDKKAKKKALFTEHNRMKMPMLDSGKYGNCPMVYPQDQTMLQLLGGQRWEGLAITTDQYRHVSKWAGIKTDFSDEPAKANALELFETEASVASMRAAKLHGMRMIAYAAEFLEPGEDPVKFLHNLMLDAGYDVPYWGDEEEEE